ncbi:hypothetical protein [Streptomyces sp. NPDC048411]|uniref:hypothetical protein n=1 Tax=Streptomyces sp. NPDC048411 TaxID=3157206 RepID=UPI003451F24A
MTQNWGDTATAATNIGHEALLSAARYLAAGAVDLIERPELLDAMKQEFEAVDADGGRLVHTQRRFSHICARGPA